ncbi:ABC transporter permease [Fodinibius sediminis]|uniref:Putative ABC transport system permease protein n=1 Tax=Fodinibius sediminis TaxID=1214077 RepID=A0A521BPS0_9BACT|nr:FtsX-like permease family protein [Fodinibius sediminis]SMO49147.1 putative ABC transport system permease protein [Fodinibius sediminis]
MKWLILIGKNLLRNKKRTFLTMGAVALALFIFTMLQSVLTAMEFQVARGAGETRVGVIEKYSGPRRSLPEGYWSQLERFEGVRSVTPTSFDILGMKRATTYYIGLLVDPESYRKVFESTASYIPPDQYEDFIKRRNGAIVGKQIMQAYGWRPGDAITLRSLQHKADLELVISGVYPSVPEATDQMDNRILIHRPYYESIVNKPGRVAIYWLRLENPASILPVIKAVTDYYSIGPREVSVQTEGSMLAQLTSYTATIQLIIRVISTVVLFTILLITINTIALSMRERRKEIALMKALGYTPIRILGLVVGEAVFTSVVAGLIGAGAAYALFNMSDLTLSLGLTFNFIVRPAVFTTALVLAVLLGIVSSLVPAYNASRINVINVLHSL